MNQIARSFIQPLTLMTRFIMLAGLVLIGLANSAWAADIVIDNGGPGFSVVGDWPLSTAVAGYEGSNYQTHIANGPVPGALTVDNQDAAFSVTGDWPLSTAVAGYLGSDYRTHAANGSRPGSIVIDNAQGTANGNWPLSTSVAGYLSSNYQTHAAGGSDTFAWPLAGTGQYRVYARWTSHANRASNASYVVSHAGGDTPVTVNQQQNGGTWQLLGTFDLDANSRVVLSAAANGYVIADAVMAEPVGAAPNTATWVLPVTSVGSHAVYARWSSHANRASNARYVVSHVGGDTPVTVNQQQNGGTWQLLGTFDLDANSRVGLTDEANGYVIADAISIVPAGAALANSASWTPVLAQADHYDVFAKWTAHPNRATNASYTVRHAAGETTVVVDQQQNGGTWQLLGRFDLAPGQAAVTLTDRANGYVIADAVRLSLIAPAQAGVFYIHPDHLGTPRVVVDETNKVVWRNLPTTEAFGNSPPEEDPDNDGQRFELNLRFPGQYFDKESGLAQNWHRDYDSSIGTYRQSDPIGLAGGINTYGYVGGNPVSYIDPTGEIAFALPALPAIAGWVGGAAAVGVGGWLGWDVVGPMVTEARRWFNNAEANREWQAYKESYSAPMPPGMDPCEEARWRLKREQDQLAARRAWDAKWVPLGAEGHSKAINQSEQAVRNAQKRVDRDCKCP